jgi:subtilisin family serine protease
MRSPARTSALVLAAWAAAGGRAWAGSLDPGLAALAARAPDEELAVIVRLVAGGEPLAAPQGGRRGRASALARGLRERAAPDRALAAELAASGARGTERLWAIGALATRVPAGALARLARHRSVERVTPDRTVLAPAVEGGGAVPATARGARVAAAAVEMTPPEWNLAAVGAPELWALGHTGGGVVVATVDTGVDPAHPDLAGKWRAGPGGWLDLHGEHPTPHDASGHGTRTAGILVGGSAGGGAIGMAPDARYIAVKLYDDAGRATLADVHRAFQWLLDPDGDPDTDDAPDVVNASFGLVDGEGGCTEEFEEDVRLLRSAGIAVVFPAGNEGPDPGTGVSPADNPSAFAAGAVDASLGVARFSSRGPSACDGRIFPQVVAPGVGVTTADLSLGGLPLYASASGTSYAAPHVAGAMALLAGAFPEADVDELEEALIRSAADVGRAGPDDDAGAGLVNVRAALDALAADRGEAPAPAWPGGGCSSAGGGGAIAAAWTLAAAALGRRARAAGGAPPGRWGRGPRPAGCRVALPRPE